MTTRNANKRIDSPTAAGAPTGDCAPCEELSFEQCLEQLDGIVRQLEDGQLSMDQALAAYEAGVKHLKRCHGLLEAAERKVEVLAGVDAAGNAVTRALEM